jgi:hypothetical protein
MTALDTLAFIELKINIFRSLQYLASDVDQHYNEKDRLDQEGLADKLLTQFAELLVSEGRIDIQGLTREQVRKNIYAAHGWEDK